MPLKTILPSSEAGSGARAVVVVDELAGGKEVVVILGLALDVVVEEEVAGAVLVDVSRLVDVVELESRTSTAGTATSPWGTVAV